MTKIFSKDDGIFQLPDGRILSYSTYGNPKGKPVFFFHGIPGTRLQRSPDLSIFEKLPFLVYALDRPGYGNSTFQKNRKLLDWPLDVAAFAEGMGINQFGVIGISGGGPYALATAYKIPDRLNHATVISGLAPLTVHENLSQFSTGGRLLFRAAETIPHFVRGLFSLLFKQLDIQLDAAFQKFMTDLPETDRRLLTDPTNAKLFKKDVAEAFKQGTQGVVADIAILMQPWDFSLEDISTPVHVWHGTADTIVPFSLGKYVIDHLPHAIPHIVEGGGHFMAIEMMDKIFEAIL